MGIGTTVAANTNAIDYILSPLIKSRGRAAQNHNDSGEYGNLDHVVYPNDANHPLIN